MRTEIFQYNNNPISFQLGNGEIMVSATQMAKPFGKQPSDFLRLSQTAELLQVLENQQSGKSLSANNQLITTVKGGLNPGTWMHEDLALIFAQWLSPEFYLWCNSRIKELLKNGVTTITNDDEVIMHAMQVLENRLKLSRERVAQLEEQNSLQSEELRLSAPKVNYYENVLASESAYCTNQIAKELGMAAKTLNRLLKERGVQYKQGKQWLLKHKYQDKGYTKTRTHYYTQDNGEQGSNMNTVWTEKGREFIHSLFKPKNSELCGN